MSGENARNPRNLQVKKGKKNFLLVDEFMESKNMCSFQIFRDYCVLQWKQQKPKTRQKMKSIILKEWIQNEDNF